MNHLTNSPVETMILDYLMGSGALTPASLQHLMATREQRSISLADIAEVLTTLKAEGQIQDAGKGAFMLTGKLPTGKHPALPTGWTLKREVMFGYRLATWMLYVQDDHARNLGERLNYDDVAVLLRTYGLHDFAAKWDGSALLHAALDILQRMVSGTDDCFQTMTDARVLVGRARAEGQI